MKQSHLTAASIACGVLCAVCVAVFMASVQGEAEAARAEALARYGGEQVEVCVATRDIAAGERVELSAVELRLWVADLLPDDAVRDSSEILGKTATSSIVKGEVINRKRFESDRDSLEVPEGKAAVSVPAKAVRAVGGAIRPTMSIDVYASGSTATTLLAHDVLVLDTSVSESGSLSSSDTGWITLAIDPERVEEVVSAAGKTDLYFVLPGQRAEDVANGTAGADAKSMSAASDSASSTAIEDSESRPEEASPTANEPAPSATGQDEVESFDEEADEA